MSADSLPMVTLLCPRPNILPSPRGKRKAVTGSCSIIARVPRGGRKTCFLLHLRRDALCHKAGTTGFVGVCAFFRKSEAFGTRRPVSTRSVVRANQDRPSQTESVRKNGNS